MTEGRDFRAEAQLVVRRAARDRRARAAARVIAGAVNDAYEDAAGAFLREIAARGPADPSPAEVDAQHAAAATMLLLAACTAAIRTKR